MTAHKLLSSTISSYSYVSLTAEPLPPHQKFMVGESGAHLSASKTQNFVISALMEHNLKLIKVSHITSKSLQVKYILPEKVSKYVGYFGFRETSSMTRSLHRQRFRIP